MRKSVLAGIFACTLILANNSSRAGATASEILESNQGDSAITLLATAVPDSDLELNEESILPQDPEEAEPEEPIEEGPVVHEVAEGESLSKVAKQYDVQWKRLYDKNEVIEDPNIIEVGLKIEIPEEDEDVVARDLPVPPPAPAPVVRAVAPATTRNSAVTAVRTQTRGSSAGNVYTAGNCTWYSKSRRPDMPNNLGNARTWAIRASNQGMATGYTPRAGAIAQKGNHVVYIESVNADGTMTLSEMNYRGLYQITTRTVSPAGWRFIY